MNTLLLKLHIKLQNLIGREEGQDRSSAKYIVALGSYVS